ncbi:hypothetical protein ACLOJK_005181 [Asimina triloba]
MGSCDYYINAGKSGQGRLGSRFGQGSSVSKRIWLGQQGLAVWAGKQIGADRRGRQRVWAGMQVQAEKNAEQVGRIGEEGRESTEAMAGLGDDGRMRGLGRRTGEEKRRGLEGGGRLVAGGGGRAGKTHGRGEEKGTRGRR